MWTFGSGKTQCSDILAEVLKGGLTMFFLSHADLLLIATSAVSPLFHCHSEMQFLVLLPLLTAQ